ncbi:uncharacterized protein LOC120418125 isoform X2 [Culex pipiens pallens]|uniref:uncharacterized protein LOC120418125 isoform X2 n=1 Tax=Culex pipiens pallens TaxID=42434 RepID=UPI001954A21E|nr:uncharacterized protein LOC120418125 isoform X2 [Culex pipiens pallens]
MSTPAKNLINDLLPIELFDQIFSHLTPAQQFTAMTTCTHWFQILGHDRYRRRLLLNPTTLTDDLSPGDLHWMKQFRLIAISDCGPFGGFPHLLTEFVDQELRDHVEDLQFGLEWIDWEDFLRDSRWPALRTLTIEAPRMEIPDAGEMRLIAPNLRRIEVADVTESVAELVQGFCDQLEEVCTVVRSMNDFEFIFGTKVFGRLRSVALKTSMWKDSEVWTDRDLTEANLKMFSGLRHLKVTDWEEKFKPVLPTILGQTTELDTLTIKGCAISCTSVRQISKMKNLRMLNLSCKVEETAPISLPLLQKLTTCYGAVLPVEVVPNLNWIQIKSLTLRDTKVEHAFLKDLMDQICTLINLNVLKFVEIKVTDSEISRLLSTLKNLRTIQFEHCLLFKDRDSTKKEDILDWSKQLKHQHPNIAFAFTNCRYL